MFLFFSGAADEGLPRKQRKMRMGEKMETTSCGMGNAGILWTKFFHFFQFFQFQTESPKVFSFRILAPPAGGN